MPLKTPKFWHTRMSIISISLIPLSWLYRFGHWVNMKCQNAPYRSDVPVICVGNAIAGGSGKTPTVVTLLKIIKENNIAKTPYIISRGYGGNCNTPLVVDLKSHTTQDVGDEALLLAQHAPTITAKNRALGAKLAEEKGADLILMDDGLQSKHLQKDINFLVIDRQIDFGNNRIIPAGPLREPLAHVLDKTDAILCIGRAFHSDLPVFEGAVKPQSDIDHSKSYIAFAGLGYPEKFKNTLLDLGVNLVAWFPFADHHNYTGKELEDLYDLALNKNATLVTTEKDYKRLSKEWQEKIEYLPITLEFKDVEKLSIFIKERVTL